MANHNHIPREFIELLLAKIDLVDLIHSHIPLQKKSANNYFARCPFHNEKSASFSVSQPKQFYYCFGCGAHGNAIDFVMQFERLNFPEAIENLARRAGMEIPYQQKSTQPDNNIPALYDLMNQVTQYYMVQLRASPQAIQYLKQRGITGVIAQQFQLGYAPSGWSHVLDQFAKTELEKKKLLETGLIIEKNEGGYYDRFRERIMFPIHDYRGRIIGFGGRVIQQGEPKYLNSPETALFQKGHELYGLYHAIQSQRRLDRLLIVEGYMDVIALHQQEITYAVATLGTATTPHHIQRLLRYTNEIVFCFDGDAAGRTAAWRALQVMLPLMQDTFQVRFLFLPDGEDPDTLVRKEGRLKFEERVASSLSLSQCFFQHLSKQYDLATMEGRARFANEALQLIKLIPANLFQSMMLEELSKRARIDLQQLKQAVSQKQASVIPEQAWQAETPPGKTKLHPALRLALSLLVQHPNLLVSLSYPIPSGALPGLDFLQRLVEIIHRNPHITTGMLLEAWREQKESAFVAKLAQWEHMVPEEGMAKELAGAIRQLTVMSINDEINRLLAKSVQEGWLEEEKQQLTDWIKKKKELEMERAHGD